ASAAARPRPREPPVMRMIRFVMLRASAPPAPRGRQRSSWDRRSLAADPAGDRRWRWDREQLADFLRSRREALQPEDVGIARGPRRRAAGLRREEVAALAGM